MDLPLPDTVLLVNILNFIYHEETIENITQLHIESNIVNTAQITVITVIGI